MVSFESIRCYCAAALSYCASLRLMRRARRDFEKDYRAFYRDGESKGRDVGMPILVRGTSRELGIVLVHGFLSAPRELAELADFLGHCGYWIYVVRVKGHGTSADDLARTTADEWRESVDAAFEALSGICKRVVLGGFSFGGGLALDCAARHQGRIAAVFAACPPLRLQNLSSRFAPSLNVWNRLMEYLHLEQGKTEFVEIGPERPEINYNRLPVASLVAMERFMDDLESRLPTITVPALIIQSSSDPVVDPAGSWQLFESLGSPHKKYKMFDFNRHGILSGPGSFPVHAMIGDFIVHLQISDKTQTD